VSIETSLIGRSQLGLKINSLTGSPSDSANKGFRIRYSVIAQGGMPSANPGELRESVYTKRKKDVIEFDFDDSGKTAHLAVQIENKGKKALGDRWFRR
jgi:S1-C subfamily serine protease